jgi:REP element-mobilizing transposase RayT
MNGTENHIHILSDLHPTIALSDYIKEINVASSKWMKKSGNFPFFTGWAEGSCALTYSYRDRDMIIEYIKNQKEHHRKVTFEDEYRHLLHEAGIKPDEHFIF